MLRNHYESITEDDRRVMARMGARDPTGVAIKMRRAKVRNVDDLVKQIDHYEPTRNVWYRFKRGLGRVMGATDYNPYAEAIRRDARIAAIPKNRELKSRLKRVMEVYK